MEIKCDKCGHVMKIKNPDAQKGGKAKSRKKIAASRRNGSLGGRPKMKKVIGNR